MSRLLAVLVLVTTAQVALAEPRTTAVGFDHVVHQRDVEVSGTTAIACVRCHDEQHGRLVGRPGHTACFGTCHGPLPTAKQVSDPDRLKLCTNCHAEVTLVGPHPPKPTVSYPPYRMVDFNLVLGHKQHRAAACTQCHDPGGKKPTAPHTRCSGCHDGTVTAGHAFAMMTCEACHPAAVGRPQPPELATVQNSVTAVFSHTRHGARGGGGKDCTTCHAKIREADETVTELPRPQAADCAHCHDGKLAFAVTTACTRCHAAPTDPFDVVRPDARFRHDAMHASVVASEPCTACHLLDAKTGEVAIANHEACTACHASDFGERNPKKCGACHNATEPWRHLRADRPLPETTEFGASLDHAKHPGACAKCHVLRTATTQLRTPRGHGACTGSGCHAATDGATPHLADCAACHRLGLAAERLAKRSAEPWSVRLGFDHSVHAKDEAGSVIVCTACHTSLVGPLVGLSAPAKATCAPCHDGARAFKLTGTTCRRCHTGGTP